MNVNKRNSWGSATEIYPDTTSGKGGKTLPPSIIRKIQHASSEGGRAHCRFCKQSFSMQYMAMVRITCFENDFACAQCRKERQLQRV